MLLQMNLLILLIYLIGIIYAESDVPESSTKITPPPCGKRNKNGFEDKKIKYKGAITQFGEFPWMGAIQEKDKPAGDRKIFKCAASLIHKQVALTAGHCVDSVKPNEIEVIFGEWDSASDSEIYPRAKYEVDEIIIHEKFLSRSLVNNIALLFLSEEVFTTYHINTVCLPLQDETPSPNINYITAGWGIIEVSNPEILQAAYLPFLSHDKCQAEINKSRYGPRFHLSKTFICTGMSAGQDQCIGDGGAPLFSNRDKNTQFGIVTFNVECEWPTVYTNVAMFVDWIKLKMKDHEYFIEEDDDDDDDDDEDSDED